MTDASNVVDMSGTTILPTYDPNWKARFDRHLAENNRLNEIPVPHCLSEEHREKVERAAKGWQDAFHAQFRTLSDYLAFTRGWSVHRSHAGRMIPWPKLGADATVEDVRRTVHELKELTERVSDAEYGLERSVEPFGVFDAKPAAGFERRTYRWEWRRGWPYPDSSFPLMVVEDWNDRDRHVGLIRPHGSRGPVPFERELDRIACELILGEHWVVRSPSWSDRSHLVSSLKGLWKHGRAHGLEQDIRLYVHYGPDCSCRSVLMNVYRTHWWKGRIVASREPSVEAAPRGLLDASIATDRAVTEALKEPVWSKEAWDAFYLSHEERKQPN